MITYEVMETERAVQFVEKNLDFLGKIRSIEHKRLKSETMYQTIITGTEESMTIDGGLSSGYAGEGPRGLSRVLQALGLSKEAADKYAKDRVIFKNGFKHNFIIGLD